jgi:hypothetical protein
MQKLIKISSLLLIAATLVMASCSSAKNGYSSKAGRGCGCPNKKGMVGY